MKILDRHILKEFLAPVGYCLSTFCMMFVLLDLFAHLSRFLRAKTPILTVLKYYACLLVPSLEYLIPAALLLATLYTLWQLTRHSEVAAMRASGISLYRIVLPFLIVGLIFSIAVGLIRELAMPAASRFAHDFSETQFQQDEAEIYRDRVYYNSVHHRMWLVEEINLEVPHILHGVQVVQERSDGSRAEEMHASRAEWLDGQWWFHDISVQRFAPNDQPVGKPVRPLTHSITEMRALTETPQDFVTEIRQWQFLSVIQMIGYLRSHTELSPEALAQKSFDLHMRFAMPWACLIVVLFGIPAGARSGRQGVFTGMLTALGLFAAFYALMQIGVYVGKKGLIWPWAAAWLSNFVFLGTGVKLLLGMK